MACCIAPQHLPMCDATHPSAIPQPLPCSSVPFPLSCSSISQPLWDRIFHSALTVSPLKVPMLLLLWVFLGHDCDHHENCPFPCLAVPFAKEDTAQSSLGKQQHPWAQHRTWTVWWAATWGSSELLRKTRQFPVVLGLTGMAFVHRSQYGPAAWFCNQTSADKTPIFWLLPYKAFSFSPFCPLPVSWCTSSPLAPDRKAALPPNLSQNTLCNHSSCPINLSKAENIQNSSKDYSLFKSYRSNTILAFSFFCVLAYTFTSQNYPSSGITHPVYCAWSGNVWVHTGNMYISLSSVSSFPIFWSIIKRNF